MRQLSQIYLVLLLLAGLQGCTTIGYYGQAVGGHLSLMMRGQPVQSVLTDPQISPELQRQLEVAQSARNFAQDTLQLPVGGAFTDYVELNHPWVVVNLVAVPELSLEPHQWCYPIIGCQAYRGYFNLEWARKEQARFDEQGFDTFIGAVTAYSTLGWFDDPLHTGFTNLPEDRMVALIFHELAHRAVYIKEDTAFNESFATAVELEGLKRWLEREHSHSGFERALLRLDHRNNTLKLVNQASQQLQALFEQQELLGVDALRQQKTSILEELAQHYALLSEEYPEPGPFGVPPVQLNNANVALFQQYNRYVPAFRQLLRDNGEDFGEFYRAVEALSRQNATEREQALTALSERFVEHL
ncbi:MAG: putative aminopeptidase [Marinobacter excellens HL-55]|uniref:Putative aminopeptidase n=1 Tax=Marinobacter excellens HL-55 TaxID=1305731 RepID=A0A0P7ZCL8_9GAMM|nr:MAG: putative aminopeptidase [Marinobacter excellens HL-55]